MRALVVGGGIAGLTVAAELAALGHEVTVCERDAAPPGPDHMIDLSGTGFDVAQRLGLLPQLARTQNAITRVVLLDGTGRTRGEVDYRRIRDAMFDGRQLHVLRSELVASLRARLLSAVEVRYGSSPEDIVHTGHHVRVASSDGAVEHYDLVVAADGRHSCVRQLVVAHNAVDRVRLGCRYAAGVIPARFPEAAADARAWLTVANVSARLSPLGRDRTAAAIVYRAPHLGRAAAWQEYRTEIVARLRGRGRLADAIVEALPASDHFRVEEVVEIHLDRWARGRVVFVGDAAATACPFGGGGASLAITGAYVLARELAQGTDIDRALSRYQTRMRPAVEAHRRCGRRRIAWMLPPYGIVAALRDRALDVVARGRLVGLLADGFASADAHLDGVIERAST
ncbi:MAG TPA: FAD-dependent oxidoreductase [Nannocystaceae bacterium]|nr:FAD-dependent oxidoreductase [Nannocystaceae bacterium]